MLLNLCSSVSSSVIWDRITLLLIGFCEGKVNEYVYSTGSRTAMHYKCSIKVSFLCNYICTTCMCIIYK